MRLGLITAAVVAYALGGSAAASEADALAEAGFPAISRPWQGPEYVKAVELFKSGQVALPLLESRQGAAILERMTSRENLEFARSKTLPMGARAQAFSQMLYGMGNWMLLYLQRVVSGTNPPPHAEFARVMAFMIDVAGVGEELMEELEPTVVAEPPDSPRREGLRRMQLGLTQVFQGAEQTLSESAYGFTQEDYARLLRAMDANLPGIRKIFASDVVIELRKRLEADEERYSGENRALLEHMVKELSMVHSMLLPHGTSTHPSGVHSNTSSESGFATLPMASRAMVRSAPTASGVFSEA
jgi:hypothetical protein